MAGKIRQLINEYRAAGTQARHFRLSPPEKLQGENSLKKWQPERLTVRQGIIETPFLILLGYANIMFFSLVINLAGIVILPQKVTLSVMFGLGTSDYYSTILCSAGIGIQMYLIYRDIIRRSVSSFLLVIPGVYFAMNVLILIQNL